MPPALPDELIAADRALDALLSRISFSRHLNPENVASARAAFVDGAEAPPFRYAPTPWADDAIGELTALRIPNSHPLGPLLSRAIGDTIALIVALRDRTAEAFDALAQRAEWYPGAADSVSHPVCSPGAAPTGSMGADEMFEVLTRALRERALIGWRVERDPVMSARVLVDSAKRIVRLNPASRFRQADAISLVAHEIDVHVMRAANGADQPLRLFANGLPGSLLTEEGLAITAEERMGTLPETFLPRQALVLRAVERARTMGFRDLYACVTAESSEAFAWQVCLRVKRGLADPGAPGVYAKDTAYYRGYRLVQAWLASGGNVSDLYVGKVATEHPVAEWLAEGLIRSGPVPEMWRAPLPIQST